MNTDKNSWFVPIIVIMVTGATIYLSVKNNTTDVVYSLCTACFGYYFGAKVSSTNTKI